MRRPERRPATAAPRGDPLDLLIRHIGAEGDGAATAPDGDSYHVARTLPGELILAQPTGPARAIATEILQASADRVSAPCPHFALCGGCAVQHWADAPYAAWKQDLVRRALQKAGFVDPSVAPLARTPPGARRRMDFSARRTDGGMLLGLHAAHSQDLVDIHSCLVLHPGLVALLDPLRALLTSLAGLRRQADLVVNLLPTGPDLLIRADAAPATTDRAKLAAFASRHDMNRIAWAVGTGPAETAAQHAPPAILFAGTQVTPPPGAFLQASPQGEAAIVAAMLAGLPRLTGRARIIELFAGIGTLSFPLAAHAIVQAFEGSPESAFALRRAAGGTRVQATHRDLTRQPLQKQEFAGAAVVVLDPPFAGAALQMATLASSGVGTIIYVSCNPVALARDASVLAQAGYGLELATPIDQFLWSAQVEAVCVFRK